MMKIIIVLNIATAVGIYLVWPMAEAILPLAFSSGFCLGLIVAAALSEKS